MQIYVDTSDTSHKNEETKWYVQNPHDRCLAEEKSSCCLSSCVSYDKDYDSHSVGSDQTERENM